MGKSNIALLDELKHLYGISTYKQIEEMFNIKVKTIDKWVSENRIPTAGFAVQYIELLIENKKRLERIKQILEEDI